MSTRKIKRKEGGLPWSKGQPAPKPKLNVGTLQPASDYAQLRILVMARPLGGSAIKLRSGQWKLERAGQCERCGLRQATDAHHRWLLSQGGPDRASNLCALCRECHDWCHKHPGAARLGGWILRPYDDPSTRALLLHDGSIATIDDDGNYSFQKWPDR